MQQSDMSSSYYQYYQSHLQNPNPSSSNNDPHLNSLPATFASAPPMSSNQSPSDYSAYSSTFLPNPQIPDHGLHSTPVASTYTPNPNSQSSDFSQPYSFPHLVSQPQPTPYYPYDQNQTAPTYDQPNPNFNSNPNSSFSANSYSSTSYGHPGDSTVSNYENPYGSNPNSSLPEAPYSSASYGQPGASTVPNYESPYAKDVNYGGYGAQGMYGKIAEPRLEQYDHGGYRDDAIGGGVYQYNAGKTEPYGARGTAPKSSSGLVFDDYGRPIGFSDGKKQNESRPSSKIVKAIPKADTEQDGKSTVQKFRVKLLSEGAGQSDSDVLCQIGLDGIRMLDPATSRTLRIYTLESLTKWEVLDSYIFAFWAKSSVDFEPRRIRLKSNSYTTNNILDTVTAASIQIKEMGGRNKPSDPLNISEQPSEKKKGFGDWMNLMKPENLEKDHWIPDEAVTKCKSCGTDFGAFVRRHHCRNCGDIYCDKCTQGRITLTTDENAQPVRVCDPCMAEVTQRLVNAKEAVGKVSGLQCHDDLAKKLQEEMDKNRKSSKGLKLDGSGMRMKEVACPICTVHLQVQVPASGSETIECSVCQHPFLVNAH
ncbi:protein FREE1-like [Cornus florida]|uniref:protein FREE1-like n=1 Tax=Cornus florida TaxID=4283 RepID=UPI0028A11E84|nr:protein FREE1-like [Cornus florida]